jgi:hypothetical protein
MILTHKQVMMVRKKRGVGTGKIYAMKVLKKSVIASLGQIEHTKAEQVRQGDDMTR